MKADRIIRGRIYPADGTGSFAEAMAIGDGKILAVGSLEDLLPWAGSETAMEEKPGLIIPGITEGHAHVTCASEMVFGLALGEADSPEEYLEKIRSFRVTHPDADYIVGSGYDNGVFDRQGPTAALMDTAVSDLPVVMIASRTPASSSSRSWRERMVSPGEISVMHLGCSLVSAPIRLPMPELRINAFIPVRLLPRACPPSAR